MGISILRYTLVWGWINQRRSDVRFGSGAVIRPRSAQCPLCAMCGRLPFGKGFLDVLSFGRCGHVCGLFVRHTEAAGHNAFR